MLALSAYLIYSIPLTAYVKPEYRSKKKLAMIQALIQQISRDRIIDKEAELKICKQIEEENKREIEFNKRIIGLNTQLKSVRDEAFTCRQRLVSDLHKAQTIMGNR